MWSVKGTLMKRLQNDRLTPDGQKAHLVQSYKYPQILMQPQDQLRQLFPSALQNMLEMDTFLVATLAKSYHFLDEF